MATYVSKRPYVYGTGRRKSSVARVHLIPGGSGRNFRSAFRAVSADPHSTVISLW